MNIGEKTEIRNYKVNIAEVGSQHGAPVAPVAGTWPPAWLAALNPPPDAPQHVDLGSLRLRGWRFPSGVVVCRCCCPKPAEAVPVVLADGDDGPQWVEEPAPTSSPATTSPKAAPVPQHPSNDPQWL